MSVDGWNPAPGDRVNGYIWINRVYAPGETMKTVKTLATLAMVATLVPALSGCAVAAGAVIGGTAVYILKDKGYGVQSPITKKKENKE